VAALCRTVAQAETAPVPAEKQKRKGADQTKYFGEEEAPAADSGDVGWPRFVPVIRLRRARGLLDCCSWATVKNGRAIFTAKYQEELAGGTLTREQIVVNPIEVHRKLQVQYRRERAAGWSHEKAMGQLTDLCGNAVVWRGVAQFTGGFDEAKLRRGWVINLVILLGVVALLLWDYLAYYGEIPFDKVFLVMVLDVVISPLLGLAVPLLAKGLLTMLVAYDQKRKQTKEVKAVEATVAELPRGSSIQALQETMGTAGLSTETVYKFVEEALTENEKRFRIARRVVHRTFRERHMRLMREQARGSLTAGHDDTALDTSLRLLQLEEEEARAALSVDELEYTNEINAVRKLETKALRRSAVEAISRRMPKRRDVEKSRALRLAELKQKMGEDDAEASRLYEERVKTLEQQLAEANAQEAAVGGQGGNKLRRRAAQEVRVAVEAELQEFKAGYLRIHHMRDAKAHSALAIIEGQAAAQLAISVALEPIEEKLDAVEDAALLQPATELRRQLVSMNQELPPESTSQTDLVAMMVSATREQKEEAARRKAEKAAADAKAVEYTEFYKAEIREMNSNVKTDAAAEAKAQGKEWKDLTWQQRHQLCEAAQNGTPPPLLDPTLTGPTASEAIVPAPRPPLLESDARVAGDEDYYNDEDYDPYDPGNEEAEERRLAWITHHIKLSELEQAKALGWNGDVASVGLSKADVGVAKAAAEAAAAEAAAKKAAAEAKRRARWLGRQDAAETAAVEVVRVADDEDYYDGYAGRAPTTRQQAMPAAELALEEARWHAKRRWRQRPRRARRRKRCPWTSPSWRRPSWSLQRTARPSATASE
jgi:hypothetical protein